MSSGQNIGYDQRLQDIPQINQGALYQQMLNLIGQTSGQREADIRQGYQEQGAGIAQQLARSGLSGTTVAPTMQLGVARERESSLNRLADEMLQTKLGVVGGELQRRTGQQENALQRLAGLEQAQMGGQYQLAGIRAQQAGALQQMQLQKQFEEMSKPIIKYGINIPGTGLPRF